MHHHRTMGGRGREHHNVGERGASLVEYALLVALVAVVSIAAVTFLGTSASGKFGSAGTAIDNTGYSCVTFAKVSGFAIVDSDGNVVARGPYDCTIAMDLYPQYFS